MSVEGVWRHQVESKCSQWTSKAGDYFNQLLSWKMPGQQYVSSKSSRKQNGVVFWLKSTLENVRSFWDGCFHEGFMSQVKKSWSNAKSFWDGSVKEGFMPQAQKVWDNTKNFWNNYWVKAETVKIPEVPEVEATEKASLESSSTPDRKNEPEKAISPFLEQKSLILDTNDKEEPIKNKTTLKLRATYLKESSQVEKHPERFIKGRENLIRASTETEKIEALRDFLYSTGRNISGDCAFISHTHAERLRTGEQLFRLTRDEAGFEVYEHKTFGKILIRDPSYDNPDLASFPKGREVLHQDFLNQFNIQEKGMEPRTKEYKNLEQSLKNAGNGAMALVFPEDHATLAINIRGDIFYIDNAWEESAVVSRLDESPLVKESQWFQYGILKDKAFGWVRKQAGSR